MGMWAYPNTEEKIARLEALMSAPIPIERLDDLWDLVGDDTFFDMAGGLPKGKDLRPVLAISLDESFAWSSEARFKDPGVPFERLRALAEPYRDVPLSDICVDPRSDGSPESAGANVAAMVLDSRTAEHDPSRFEVEPGLAPATHVVRDVETGKVYRFEHVYGVIVEPVEGSHAESLYARPASPKP